LQSVTKGFKTGFTKGSTKGSGLRTELMSHPPQLESKKLVQQIPANLYVERGLQKPYAKKKLGESCGCVTLIDSTNGCCCQDRNTWNSLVKSSLVTAYERFNLLLSQGKKRKEEEVADDEDDYDAVRTSVL
jgi:hypothetical protein